MSEKFDVVKKYYTDGLWDGNKVRDAVTKNWITEVEFTEITGLNY